MPSAFPVATPDIRPVSVIGTGSLYTGSITIYGYSLRNTAAGAGVFRIYDNDDAASGIILVTLALAAGEAQTITLGAGLQAVDGLFFESGAAIEGSVWIR